MPKCLVCDRIFCDRQALHQHLQSSGDRHPVCIPCGRRFISDQAKDEVRLRSFTFAKAHDAARHPTTFPCTICGRSFDAQFALEDHYRGSAAHPNCPKCGRGFKDKEQRDAHHTREHPRVACAPCSGMLVYEDALSHHYTVSSKHPNCKACGHGFRDLEALERHDPDPEAHPQCVVCKILFKDRQGLEVHVMERHEGALSVAMTSPAMPPELNGNEASAVAPLGTPSGGTHAVAAYTPLDLRIAELVQQFEEAHLSTAIGVGAGKSTASTVSRERMTLNSPPIRARWSALPNINSSHPAGEARRSMPPPYAALNPRSAPRFSGPLVAPHQGSSLWGTAGLGVRGPLGRDARGGRV
ncbi:hypothetical protein LshimejAT787_0602610 [Lyophyllum shimeji]|uniref:C2H2-type domain-containing protein n=1 Tax=Lyophyllum shimeji TaxID=47721 RepID=A0A9P3ULC9_LYOSH|nr:hypothetical protein LshimejAT787_0602610 [Lyophyllum shimeji]